MKCPQCRKPMRKCGKAGSGRQRWGCLEHGRTTDPTKAKPATRIVKAEAKLEFKAKTNSQTLVITWAQNATPAHKGFLASLGAYCRESGAILLVVPGRYKNATSRWTASQENEQWWDKALTPFLHNQRTKLNKNLVLLGDISTQPTATAPLSGFEGITHGESGILGHPKLQMVVVPTPHQRLPKILTTTGACTVANYSDTKTGKKGDFHHVIGAVVCELDRRGLFHLRHINARGDGAFCDLDKAYYPDGSVQAAGAYQGLVFGDTHVRFTDPKVTEATFGKGGLVERLNPQTLVFHDLLDSYAVNPHHFGKPFLSVAKHRAGYAGIQAEVEEAVNWLRAAANGRQARVIASNHNDFLSRWMNTQDWRFDSENAEFYLETALYMARSSKMESFGASVPDPFQYWLAKLAAKDKHIRCINRHESLMIGGVELSLHGDQGPNGARGSRANLSKIGVKTMIGHSHAPGITEGCYQVGTSTPPRLEYSSAVSSSLQCHGSIDAMGKRHLHLLINGKFWS